MELGIVGLGRMGANMTERLVLGGHRLITFDRNPEAIQRVVDKGALGAYSLADFIKQLSLPRAIWLMVPSGDPVDQTIEQLLPNLSKGDILIDGGNSNYKDSIRRAEKLKPHGMHFVDAGTSGGVWGRTEGYCLMVGGADEHVAVAQPVFDALKPPEGGFVHAGPVGTGHFTKMVHNGIEYGLMQAYAEGFEIMHASDYELDLGAISEMWMHGSVVRSWLLELMVRAYKANGQDLTHLKGWVADSGEGRWTVQEAIDKDVPAPVITLALLTRLRSRQDDSYGAKVLAALRNEFGGHAVKSE
jgi:6-phosphogluconate dehydrogenase